MKRIITFSTCFLLFISISCENEKQRNKNNRPKTTKTTSKINKWNINSICECYDEAFSRLEAASKIRNSYSSFDEYKENKVDVRRVKTKTKEHIDLIAFPELFITGYNLKDNYNTV